MAFWPSGGFGDSTQVGFKLFTIFVDRKRWVRWVINGQRGSKFAWNAKDETKLHLLGRESEKHIQRISWNLHGDRQGSSEFWGSFSVFVRGEFKKRRLSDNPLLFSDPQNNQFVIKRPIDSHGTTWAGLSGWGPDFAGAEARDQRKIWTSAAQSWKKTFLGSYLFPFSKRSS